MEGNFPLFFIFKNLTLPSKIFFLVYIPEKNWEIRLHFICFLKPWDHVLMIYLFYRTDLQWAGGHVLVHCYRSDCRRMLCWDTVFSLVTQWRHMGWILTLVLSFSSYLGWWSNLWLCKLRFFKHWCMRTIFRPILLDCVPVVHVPMECVEDPPQQEPLQQQQLQQLEQQQQQQHPQQPQLLPALLRGEISAMIQHILIYIHSSAALHTLVLRSQVELSKCPKFKFLATTDNIL